MQTAIYNPFHRFDFNYNKCFLTGSEVSDRVSVFPSWLIERGMLGDLAFKMLDESMVRYADLWLPASKEVAESAAALDEDIQAAFNAGHSAVKELPEIKLFQWVSLRMFGIIYQEINRGLQQQKLSGEAFNFSQGLSRKFSNLHIMLQSLVRPVEFEGPRPWSIYIFEIENPEDKFMYRDEINTLIYSLRIGNVGMIVCLQDNEESKQYHRDLLEACKERILSLIQFEEVCARFFYSAYLFNRLPDYSVVEAHGSLFIEPMPMHMNNAAIFDKWQNKTYAQVLENFFKPWGYTMFEILKDPEKPMTFL